MREVVARLAESGGESISLQSGHLAHALPAPGRSLAAGEQRLLAAAITALKTAAYGADADAEWLADGIGNYLERLDELVLIADSAGDLVGWAGYTVLDSFDDMTAIYLDSTGMVADHRSRGAISEVYLRRLLGGVVPTCRPGLPIFVSARTRNPAVFTMIRGLLRGRPLQPRAEGGTIPPEMQACAARVVGWLDSAASVDPGTLIGRDAYPADGPSGDEPSSKDPAIDDWFRHSLGPRDAFVLVGRIGVTRERQVQPG